MQNCNLLKSCFLFIIAITQTSCDQISAGAYPFAERYVVQSTEETLLDAIEKFRIENPEYNPPNKFPLTDGKVNADDYFYHLYFYYPQEQKFVKCWIRSDVVDKNQTIFAFVAINTGSGLGNWKQINHDLGNEADKIEKQKFEKLILGKIITNLQEVN